MQQPLPVSRDLLSREFGSPDLSVCNSSVIVAVVHSPGYVSESGSSADSPSWLCGQAARSRQGKVEKSLLSFAATYPGWAPDAAAAQLLSSVSPAAGVPGRDVSMGAPQRSALQGIGPRNLHPPTASSVLGVQLTACVPPPQGAVLLSACTPQEGALSSH